MGFDEAIKAGFSNYLVFSGRALRSEYWYWTLFLVLGGISTAILDTLFFGSSFDAIVSPLNAVFNMVTLLPTIAVSIRRLHDIDRTGWWSLICLTVIGILLLIYWACQPGTPGPNRFGSEPSLIQAGHESGKRH
jgi:uncharacterized membrane protein YhaH (DUF805 family)